MTTMRVIVEEMLAVEMNAVEMHAGEAPGIGPASDAPTATAPTRIARYTEELTRALIDFAPPGCFVEAIASSGSPGSAGVPFEERLPGLTGVYRTSLARRELVAAWQHGFTRLPGGGVVHAPSLLAPLGRHDRRAPGGQQIAVTVHDVVAWTHPGLLAPRRVSWYRAMAKRAHRYADAVVVPTHAVADGLAAVHDFGDRVRIVGGAVSPRLALPADADARARRLGLPPRYLVAMGGGETADGLDQLFAALAVPGTTPLPLLVVGALPEPGPDDPGGLPGGLPAGRVTPLGNLGDADLAVVLDRAVLLVYPGVAEGFGLPVLEAFHFGTPVVHSDDPALVEVAADAGVTVPLAELDGYPARLAAAITRVAEDDDLARRLGTAGEDRAGLFTWRATAESTWQLHADL